MTIFNTKLVYIDPGKRNSACSTCKGKTRNAFSRTRHNGIQSEKFLAIKQVQFVGTALDRTDYAADTIFACLGHEPTIADELF
jgi:hypothetical protein